MEDFLGGIFQMRLFRIFAIATMAMLSTVSAQAGVVLYSNMGNDGLTSPGDSSKYDQTVGSRISSGFMTGSATVAQFSVSLELGIQLAGNYGNKRVTIYINDDGADGDRPNGGASGVHAVSNEVFVSGRGVYTFGFSPGTTLSANTKYWVVADTGLDWFRANEDQPEPVNSSGFSFVGAVKEFSTDNWSGGSDLGDLTLSIALPEPALTSMFCIGGIALIRRSRRRYQVK